MVGAGSWVIICDLIVEVVIVHAAEIGVIVVVELSSVLAVFVMALVVVVSSFSCVGHGCDFLCRGDEVELLLLFVSLFIVLETLVVTIVPVLMRRWLQLWLQC